MRTRLHELLGDRAVASGRAACARLRFQWTASAKVWTDVVGVESYEAGVAPCKRCSTSIEAWGSSDAMSPCTSCVRMSFRLLAPSGCWVRVADAGVSARPQPRRWHQDGASQRSRRLRADESAALMNCSQPAHRGVAVGWCGDASWHVESGSQRIRGRAAAAAGGGGLFGLGRLTDLSARQVQARSSERGAEGVQAPAWFHVQRERSP